MNPRKRNPSQGLLCGTSCLWISYQAALLPKSLVLLSISIFLSSCAAYKIPPKKIIVVTRETNSDQLLPGVQVAFYRDGTEVHRGTTDSLGYLEVKPRTLGEPGRKKAALHQYEMVCTKSFSAADDGRADTVRMPLNNFLSFCDVYLTDSAREVKLPPPVADFHYHLSLRAHNLFGPELFDERRADNVLPKNLTWHRYYRKIRVLRDGKLERPRLQPINFTKVRQGHPRWTKRREQLEILLNRRWLRPKPSSHNNSLLHYTQARPNFPPATCATLPARGLFLSTWLCSTPTLK